ncbi:DUF1493 family protein [Uliginosibacterium gangwonense]|uniref:DUF1493 family protein n=1 Tax=Uliginosibacterium gangwonense TaxID=392736 RepID=UPI00037D4E81|nr:DUF1493 family protein [Uliginosibacterium gangwonense]
MVEFVEIEQFVQEQTGRKRPLAASLRLEEDLDITGDDYFELVDDFSHRFDVNTEHFLWYFHCKEEPLGSNLGAWFFPTPDQQVERISITLGHLHHFAQAKRWDVSYPEHNISLKRHDIKLNNALYIGLPFLLISLLWLLS